MNKNLRKQLLEMVRVDNETRARLADSGVLFDGYHPDMETVHNKNADALADLLTLSGWPTKRLVGDDGAEAAWIVAQHAISKPAFQRRCLKLLQKATANGDVPAYFAAYLEDRIRILEGHPQLYGTGFDWDRNGELSPVAIAEPDSVNERRESVDLEPLEEVIKRHRESALKNGEKPPTDPEQREKKFLEWARAVGWRESD